MSLLIAEDFDKVAEILSDPGKFQKNDYGFDYEVDDHDRVVVIDSGQYCYLGAVKKVWIERVGVENISISSTIENEAEGIASDVDERCRYGIPDLNDEPDTTNVMMAEVARKSAEYLRYQSQVQKEK